MINTEQIKRELKEVRYYFLRKDNMDELFRQIGQTGLWKLAQKYNNTIRSAPARLYDLYGCLYVQNKTQEAVSQELGYSPEYIRKFVKELFVFFQKKLSEQEPSEND